MHTIVGVLVYLSTQYFAVLVRTYLFEFGGATRLIHALCVICILLYSSKSIIYISGVLVGNM